MDLSTGEKIMVLRKRKGLSQSEFAHEIGVNKMTVMYYETEKFKPSADMLPKIASALGVSIDFLLSN